MQFRCAADHDKNLNAGFFSDYCREIFETWHDDNLHWGWHLHTNFDGWPIFDVLGDFETNYDSCIFQFWMLVIWAFALVDWYTASVCSDLQELTNNFAVFLGPPPPTPFWAFCCHILIWTEPEPKWTYHNIRITKLKIPNSWVLQCMSFRLSGLR